ncbi:MAG: DUF6973 domain-containing protein, partial [Geminicoccaceae bacterium]
MAITPAIKQSVDSQLAGRENGPADAYRHLLWGAELTRKFGPDVARTILERHEIQGDLSTRVGLGSQSPAAAAMDRHNNVLAVEIGRTARTWNDVEQGARGVVQGSSGDGSDGGAVWLPESQWSSHPKDPTTGEELPPENWDWPEIDWEGGSVESNPLYRYPYGGEEHRHEPAIDDPRAILDPAGPASDINPLSRPVASWNEDDLRRVMASPAYWQPSHPGRARAHAMVREWFERAERTGA